MLQRPSLLGPALSLLAAPLAASDVIKVDDDGGPGVQYATIADAVDAAAPGDLILVAEGDYRSTSVFIDKPLSLVAEPGARVQAGILRATSIATGELLLQGLEIRPFFTTALVLSDVSVTVVVQDCVLGGGLPQAGVGSGMAASIDDCSAVNFTGCTLEGGFEDAGSGAPALLVLRSGIYLFSSSVVGGLGSPAALPFQPPLPGGEGLVARDSLVHCELTTIRGGAGGDGAGSFCTGANGGDGVVLLGAAEIHLLDASAMGGPGGASDTGCGPATAGADLVQGTGTVVVLPGPARTLAVDALLRESRAGTITVHALPGEVAVLGYTLRQAPRFLPGIATPLLLSSAMPERIALGTIPASGTLSLGFSALLLPPSLSFFKLNLQLAVFGGQGLVLGNARTLVFLDAAF